MNRRTLLATTGTFALISLTGCLGTLTSQRRQPTPLPDGRESHVVNVEYLLSIDDFEETGWQQVEPSRPAGSMFERVDEPYVHVVLSIAEFYGSVSMAMTQFSDRYDQITAQNVVELLPFADEGFAYRLRGNEAIAIFRERNLIGTITYTILKSTTAEPRSIGPEAAVQYAEKMYQKAAQKLSEEKGRSISLPV
jgi:hypothetical protein